MLLYVVCFLRLGGFLLCSVVGVLCCGFVLYVIRVVGDAPLWVVCVFRRVASSITGGWSRWNILMSYFIYHSEHYGLCFGP